MVFQSTCSAVFNAAAWSIAGFRHADDITDTRASLRWLGAPCTGENLV